MDIEEFKQQFWDAKNNLYDDCIIYHSKVTVLLKLTTFDIKDTRVEFVGKVIKPVDSTQKYALHEGYSYFAKKGIKTFCPYSVGPYTPQFENGFLVPPYGSCLMWFDKVLVKIAAENDDNVNHYLRQYLFSSGTIDKGIKSLLYN